MLAVSIYIQDAYSLEYNRVDLFDDEKISVVSSIQNINDISKTYTDFSQTFTVPTTKQNNKIFHHWYDNSNESPFSVLVKANAYIEIDTILFRKGKIQLESVNIIDGQPKDYSITFIGLLGNLKDIFAGKFLKDLTATTYDFLYTPNEVLSRVVDGMQSRPVMFPLITSNRVWNVSGAFNADAVNWQSAPIRYNELFPAIKVVSVFDMIETEFGIDFEGTFLDDSRFQNAYLYLKNADSFILNFEPTKTIFSNNGTGIYGDAYRYDLTLQRLNEVNAPNPWNYNSKNYYFYSAEATFSVTPTASNIKFKVYIYQNGTPYGSPVEFTSVAGVAVSVGITARSVANASSRYWEFYVASSLPMTYTPSIFQTATFFASGAGGSKVASRTITGAQVSITSFNLAIRNYFPEIKIEDFFTGILKMFNLTCFSNDGINYTVEQIQNYYRFGSSVDITKYVLQDKTALNRVKTYKRINFDYEKSQSFVNVAFSSNAGIEYGSLYYENDPKTEGEEYSIKLPFEDLNFQRLSGTFQVGYCLKTDYKPYIPKPIILYDYNSATTTPAGFTFYTSGALIGNGDPRTQYKAFGQETLADNDTWSLNFPLQQSTLTNTPVENGLYQSYYEKYFRNIYNYKARLVKLSAILPTSILTTLKLNDNIVIRDAKYLINSYTTDLTTGQVQMELITDSIELAIETPILPDEVEIGAQTWKIKSANIKTYSDGTAIFLATSNAEWQSANTNKIGAYCHVNNNPANDEIYGLLYNWYAVMGIYDLASFNNISLRKTFAPVGFHVPTKTEFDTLKLFINPNGVAGQQLRTTGTLEAGTGLWKTSAYVGTNTSGFSALPAGYIVGGNTVSFSEEAKFWTSTVYDSYVSGQSWNLPIEFDTPFVFNDYWYWSYGMSVRLIKD